MKFFDMSKEERIEHMALSAEIEKNQLARADIVSDMREVWAVPPGQELTPRQKQVQSTYLSLQEEYSRLSKERARLMGESE